MDNLTIDQVNNPEFIRAGSFHKGRLKPVQLIVIHTMEAVEKPGTARAVAHYFNQAPGVSAHYCVDRDELIQCVYDSDTAWACINANSNGVHIEHAGYAKQNTDDWHDEYSTNMLLKSAQIAAYLAHKFSIPIAKAVFWSKDNSAVLTKGFCGHLEVPNHGSHTDPGTEFPWDEYLANVQNFYNSMYGG